MIQRSLRKYSKRWQELQKRIEKTQVALNGLIGKECLLEYFGDPINDKLLDKMETFLAKRLEVEGYDLENILIVCRFRKPNLVEMIADEARILN